MLVNVPLFVPVPNLVGNPFPFCVSVFIVVLFIEPVLDPDPVSVPVSLSIAVQVLFSVLSLFFCLCLCSSWMFTFQFLCSSR